MKCDELQERWFEAYPVEGDQIIPTKVYGKKDADDAIAELKCELKDVIDDRNEFKKLYNEQTENLCIEKTNVDTLEQALNQMQRTLWLARAERANSTWNKILRDSGIYFAVGECLKWDQCNTLQKKWQVVERKCRAKAKEFV